MPKRDAQVEDVQEQLVADTERRTMRAVVRDAYGSADRGEVRDVQRPDTLRAMIEDGAVTPAIDRVCSLPEVPDAIRDLEAGRVRGKIVAAV